MGDKGATSRIARRRNEYGVSMQGPSCIAAALIWITAVSLAHAQSCTVYEANAGLAAESPWETSAQQAANVLVEMCNSGVAGNRACFAGYSDPPGYTGCAEGVPGSGVTCTAEMPATICSIA